MKTIKWTGDNLDNPAILVCDFGNNYFKVYAFFIEGDEIKSKEFSIPHGYRELNQTEWHEAIHSVKNSRNRTRQSHTFQIVTGGTAKEPQLKAVSIGKAAFDSNKNNPLLGSNKYVVGGIDALLCAVISEVFPKEKYPKGHNNLIVGYGFPPTEWQQSNEIESLINKTHRIIDPDGKKRSFRVRASIAVDENVGGLVNAMSFQVDRRDAETGQFTSKKFQPDDRIIVFDAGGWLGSMAWAHIDDNGFAVMEYENEVAAIDGGAITIRESLRQVLKGYSEFRGMRNKDLTDNDMDKTLKTGQYILSGNKNEPFDASNAIEDALTYIKDVKDIYVNRFGSGRAAHHILMTGGTTNPIYDYLVEMFNHSSIHLAGKRDEIYMANVQGMMIIVIDRLIADGLLPEPYQLLEESDGY